MDAHKCDRCGKYYDEPTTKYDYRVHTYNPRTQVHNSPVDLCETCALKLEYFLNNARLTVDMKGENS